VRADRHLQQRLLQVLLPALLTPATAAQQNTLHASSVPICITALVDLTPDAVAAHMSTPAGLRSLQGASQQLQLETEAQKRQQRRQQRRAAVDSQQAGGGGQSQAAEAQLSLGRQPCNP